jgi:hypothetical protein
MLAVELIIHFKQKRAKRKEVDRDISKQHIFNNDAVFSTKSSLFSLINIFLIIQNIHT